MEEFEFGMDDYKVQITYLFLRLRNFNPLILFFSIPILLEGGVRGGGVLEVSIEKIRI